MTKIYNFFGGRSTFFAFAFLSFGIALAFLGKLSTQYVGLASGVQLLVVAHSIKEDHFAAPDDTPATDTPAN